MSSPTSTGLVIPCFRESKRLPNFLPLLCQALAEAESSVAILLVDDGSGEREAESLSRLAERLRATFPALLPPLLLTRHQGKGAAIRAGWDQLAPSHTWLAFIDADGAVSPRELLRLLQLQGTESEAIFSSRRARPRRKVERAFDRRLMGLVFHLLEKLLLDTGLSDTQCGCKMLPSSLWQALSPQARETQFLFDIELAILLQRAGVPIREVPIDWQEVGGSRLHWSEPFRMAASLGALRHRLLGQERT
ncbi:MAG: glycosyltransferase [Verrucomicrobiota bacterium]